MEASMINPRQSAFDELSDLLEEDGLFQYSKLTYVRPSIVTIKVEPSSAVFSDAPATKLGTNETVQEEVLNLHRTAAHRPLLDPS
jgi:hypothetical protein